MLQVIRVVSRIAIPLLPEKCSSFSTVSLLVSILYWVRSAFPVSDTGGTLIMSFVLLIRGFSSDFISFSTFASAKIGYLQPNYLNKLHLLSVYTICTKYKRMSYEDTNY